MKFFYRIVLVLLLSGLQGMATVFAADRDGVVDFDWSGRHLLPSLEMVAGNLIGTSEEREIYLAMLGSSDHQVQRLAAKKIYQAGISDAEVLEVISQRLDDIYLVQVLHPTSQDAGAWFCRVLGEFGQGKYAEQLAIVFNSTPHPKIRKYAKLRAASGIDTVVTLEDKTGPSAGDMPAVQLDGVYRASVTSSSHYAFKNKKHRSFMVEFTQNEDEVIGFSKQLKLKIVGKMKGNSIEFYTLASKAADDDLDGQWTVSADGKQLRGKWSHSHGGGRFDLNKIE